MLLIDPNVSDKIVKLIQSYRHCGSGVFGEVLDEIRCLLGIGRDCERKRCILLESSKTGFRWAFSFEAIGLSISAIGSVRCYRCVISVFEKVNFTGTDKVLLFGYIKYAFTELNESDF